MNIFRRLFNYLFGSNHVTSPAPVLSPVPAVVVPTNLPAKGVPSINLGKISCETDDQIQMIKDGFVKLNTVISSLEYKNEFMAFPFEQTNGMTNQQLWDLFVSNSPVTVNVDLHDMGWKYDHIYHTVGLEDASDPDTVYMNSYIVQSSYMVADNALHEVWHKLGLSHRRPSDLNSAPYGNNTIFESVAAKLGIKK